MPSTFKVSNTQRHEVICAATELLRRINLPGGCPSDPEELLKILGWAIRPAPEQEASQFSSVVLAPEYIPDKWAVIADVKPSQFKVSDLRMRMIVPDDRLNTYGRVPGEEIRQFAISLKCNFGLVDGKRILAEQHYLSYVFRNYWIPLAGTILLDDSGSARMPCMLYDDDRWYIGFLLLTLSLNPGVVRFVEPS